MTPPTLPASQPDNMAAGRPYLDPIPFSTGRQLTADTFPLVAGFSCNKPSREESRFERDVTEWLTSDGPGGALEAVRLHKAEVRLFFHADARLIGYGAIGLAEWDFAGTRTPVWLLHYFGVHTDCRDEKPSDYRRSYGRRILGGILEEVIARGGSKWFALYVDPENPARSSGDPARKAFYPDFGFAELDDEMEGDRRWVRMIRPIP